METTQRKPQIATPDPAELETALVCHESERALLSLLTGDWSWVSDELETEAA